MKGAITSTENLFKGRKWELSDITIKRIKKGEYLKIEKRDTTYTRVSPTSHSGRYWLTDKVRRIYSVKYEDIKKENNKNYEAYLLYECLSERQKMTLMRK